MLLSNTSVQAIDFKMAVSFASGSLALANWGFSAGDIAAIAGGGRSAGNWLMAQFRDRSLLEFLAVDVENIILRKGLLDVVALHSRWDQKLFLLKNGKMVTIQEMGGSKIPLIPNMDKFTWLMALITAALDASLDSKLLRELMTKFLTKLFEESVTGGEYLQREAMHHIQGWLSVAFVRGITWKARGIWSDLANSRKHPPGLIPESDHGDLYRFLMWVTTGEERVFYTSSSDIFSVAMVLEELGLEIQTTEDSQQHIDESQIVVRWSADLPYPTAFSVKEQRKRRGMRIPLAFMEEVASLFPTDRNKLRCVFEDGMRVVKQDKIHLLPFCDEEPPAYDKSPAYSGTDNVDMWYEIASDSKETVPRLDNFATRLAKVLLPSVTPAAARALQDIVRTLGDDARDIVSHLAFDRWDPDLRTTNQSHEWNDNLSQLQVFVLGYYYELFWPLLNTSQMAEQEAFGSWGWYDMSCLVFIKKCLHGRGNRPKDGMKVPTIYRHDMMNLMAYLFAGAGIDQLSAVRQGALGIIGKLSLVESTLLGATADSEDFGKLFLLDVDPASIPCSAAGVVYPGCSVPVRFKAPKSGSAEDISDLSLEEVEAETADDFTTHIEPDWDYDTQTCLVAYRHRGRIVHRLDPWLISISLWKKYYEHNMRNKDNKYVAAAVELNQASRKRPASTRVHRICLEEFHGGMAPYPEETLTQIPEGASAEIPIETVFIDTNGRANARICITAMYENKYDAEHVEVVSTRAEVAEAVKQKKKVIVL